MTIKVEYALWQDKKIQNFTHLNINEDDLIQYLQTLYENDELPIPININKDEVTPVFNICNIDTNII